MLLQVVDRLCLELGCAEEGEELSRPTSDISRRRTRGVLAADDEELAVAMRNGLARIAAAAGAPERAFDDQVHAALEGSELVIRGALVSGNSNQLASLMPSFVFLVTLPIVEQDRALELARRATELIEAEREG